jgi:ribosome-associated protein
MYIDEKNIKIKTSRSSGPGGQNVNKRSTRVQVWVGVNDLNLSDEEKERIRAKLTNKINERDEIETESDEERLQEQNRERAIEKLNALIEEALHEDEPRIPTEPHQGAVEKRLRHKHLRYQKKKNRREGRGVGVEEHHETI